MATPELFDDSVFRTGTRRTTRGYRINFAINDVHNMGDWPADYAREIARRLLVAADECERLDSLLPKEER